MSDKPPNQKKRKISELNIDEGLAYCEDCKIYLTDMETLELDSRDMKCPRCSGENLTWIISEGDK